jgi:hypothetical protein
MKELPDVGKFLQMYGIRLRRIMRGTHALWDSETTEAMQLLKERSPKAWALMQEKMR